MAGSRIRLTARLSFDGECRQTIEGKTVEDIVLGELKRQFSHDNPNFRELVGNEYDFPDRFGQRIKIASKFEVVARPPYVRFHFLPARGICAVPFFPLWRRRGSKHIFLFLGDVRVKEPYSALGLAKVAAHEFGHVLGIGDLYGGMAPYGLCYRQSAAVTAEMPLHDIMRRHFDERDFFTANDLEMALSAQEENAPQTHVPTGFWWKGLGKVSRAVRLQNVNVKEKTR